MQALVLDGFYSAAPHPEVRYELERQLEARKFAVETAVLRDMEVAPCRGCFDCWIETPGICIIDDAGRELARRSAQCDLLVQLTPLVFGCYSAELKKFYDRLIPILSPFFTIINNEMHHQRRYRTYPRLMALGACPQPDAEATEIFTTLVERNALNFHYPIAAAGVYDINSDQSTLASLLSDLLAQVTQEEQG